MRLKNDIDYKRFPEPYRGHKGRFTILVLSAEIPYRALCKGFFIKSGPKNVPKMRKVAHKKLFEDERLLEKDTPGFSIIFLTL